MTDQETEKIIRFSKRLPDNLKDHWNEIVEIINKYDNGSIDKLQDENYEMASKIRDGYKHVLILRKWMEERKINSMTGFYNVTDMILTKLKEPAL
jgi:uncharacterized protein YeeX (DUF496 family)